LTIPGHPQSSLHAPPFNLPSLYILRLRYTMTVGPIVSSLMMLHYSGVINRLPSPFASSTAPVSPLQVLASSCIIRPPNSSYLLTLLPSYYLPAAPHHTFSLNALKHYLLLPLFATKHTRRLSIMLLSKIDLHFPSIPSTVVTSGLDFFHAEGVKRSNIGGVIDI
jgi:hypothetical protein